MSSEPDTSPLPATVHYKTFDLQPQARRLLVRGRSVQIGARAFDLLVALIERDDRVVSKHELLDVVWPNLVVEENNLQVHIHALRKLLGPKAITTIPGRGYRFTAERSDAANPPAESTGDGDGDGESTWRRGAPGAPRGARMKEGNLPAAIPELYGRDAVIGEIADLLKSRRLVTIAGSGGIGKTRLAQTVAHRLRDTFDHGVWMIELAAVLEPDRVPQAIARTLGITLANHRSPVEALASALHDQSLLLVLDNCEHLVEAIARLASDLLDDAPGVRIMATSQEILRIANEYVHRLGPLTVPTDCGLEDALDYGAVRLFVERVRALDAGFQLDHHNLPGVVAICERLGGIALAIELAAARVPMLGVHGIHDRLGERLRVLTGGARVSLRRHQTLRATLDWSHQLLNADEARVFRRLAVFSDGFIIEGAQQVGCDAEVDEWALLDILGALVDKSLVLVDSGERPRYRMLETTRGYALEKLAEAGETDDSLKRHAEATDAICRKAVKERDSELLWAELHNVRAAFDWAMADRRAPKIAVSLATLSAMPLAVTGFVEEALGRLKAVEPLVTDEIPRALAARYWQWYGRAGVHGRLPISLSVSALVRAEALFADLGTERHVHACKRARAETLLAGQQFEAARVALDEAEAMEGIGWPLADRMRRLRVLALLQAAQGQLEPALDTARIAFDMADSAGMERYVLILLNDIAMIQLQIGDAAAAARGFDELASRASGRRSQGLTLAQGLAGLMAALIAQNDLDQARHVGLRALPLLRRSGSLLMQCDLYGWLAARDGRGRASARLLGVADAAHDAAEATRDSVRQHARDEALRLVLAIERPETVDQAMTQGRAAGEDEIAHVIESFCRPGDLAEVIDLREHVQARFIGRGDDGPLAAVRQPQ